MLQQKYNVSSDILQELQQEINNYRENRRLEPTARINRDDIQQIVQYGKYKCLCYKLLCLLVRDKDNHINWRFLQPIIESMLAGVPGLALDDRIISSETAYFFVYKCLQCGNLDLISNIMTQSGFYDAARHVFNDENVANRVAIVDEDENNQALLVDTIEWKLKCCLALAIPFDDARDFLGMNNALLVALPETDPFLYALHQLSNVDANAAYSIMIDFGMYMENEKAISALNRLDTIVDSYIYDKFALLGILKTILERTQHLETYKRVLRHGLADLNKARDPSWLKMVRLVRSFEEVPIYQH